MVAALNSTRRMPGLDALRGLSAFGVLLWHYGAHFSASPLLDWFRPFYTAGLYLVDVFFVLSGFLLGHLYRHRDDWKPFLFKRAIRLFPLHWTTLIVVAILQSFYLGRQGSYFVYPVNDLDHFVLNLGLLQYVGLQQGFSFNGPSWSISVEWIANLVFLPVLLLCRFRRGLSALLALGAGVGLWVLHRHLIGSGILWGWLDAAVLRGIFGFFAGVYLAEVLPAKSNFPRAYDALGVLAATILLVFMNRPGWQRLPGIDFVAIGLLVPALVAACSRGTVLARLSLWRPLVWLGDVSFSVYLWHFPLQVLFALILAYGVGIDYSSPWILALFVGLSYLLGHLSWIFLEKPAQRLARNSRIGQWWLRAPETDAARISA